MFKRLNVYLDEHRPVICCKDEGLMILRTPVGLMMLSYFFKKKFKFYLILFIFCLCRTIMILSPQGLRVSTAPRGARGSVGWAVPPRTSMGCGTPPSGGLSCASQSSTDVLTKLFSRYNYHYYHIYNWALSVLILNTFVFSLCIQITLVKI